jgi:hypothetical protein
MNTNGNEKLQETLPKGTCRVVSWQGIAEVALQFDSLHSIAFGFRVVQTGGHCNGNLQPVFDL